MRPRQRVLYFMRGKTVSVYGRLVNLCSTRVAGKMEHQNCRPRQYHSKFFISVKNFWKINSSIKSDLGLNFTIFETVERLNY